MTNMTTTTSDDFVLLDEYSPTNQRIVLLYNDWRSMQSLLIGIYSDELEGVATLIKYPDVVTQSLGTDTVIKHYKKLNDSYVVGTITEGMLTKVDITKSINFSEKVLWLSRSPSY